MSRILDAWSRYISSSQTTGALIEARAVRFVKWPLVLKKPASSLTWLGKYLSLALTLPACVVAGYFLGAALDAWLHTTLLKVVCIFLGMAAGIVQIVRELSRDSGS